MTEWTTTRRGVVVAAGVGLAGCLGSSDDDGGNGNSNENGEDGTEDSTERVNGVPAGDIEARREQMPDPGVAVDWSTAREFRKWLFDDGNESNGRFDYTADLPPAEDVDSPVIEVLDVYPDQVDALVSQGTTQVVLGQFDADALETQLAESDRYEVADEYGGYAVADGADDETSAGPIAVGDDALILGSGYENPIDARHGDRDRLEDVDPWMTHLLETLPEEPLVTGEYLEPLVDAIDIPEIYCWGLSMPGRDPETATWAFVFDDPDDITDDVRTELRTLADEVDTLEVDGRTLTMDGTVPENSDAGQ
ncbi:hypothetical protein [Haloterrigena salifodinae]|uniref:hypothetical protein n=1 Tax=Haloterrigena salifodinae TaxID=2675099 RepID=UPI000F86FF43|nr:hypothetical protein [Haloterrigena salifodinae]